MRPEEVAITIEDELEEILMMEDENNLLKLSLKTLKKNGCGNIYITRDSKEVLHTDINGNSHGINSNNSEFSYALIFTNPPPNMKNIPELIQINSKLKVIPLLLLMEPKKDMYSIMSKLDGEYYCFKESVNLSEFFGKVKEMPMFWASIYTKRENSGE